MPLLLESRKRAGEGVEFRLALIPKQALIGGFLRFGALDALVGLGLDEFLAGRALGAGEDGLKALLG